jgi:anti-anti-sigma regulatory factor
VLRIDRSANGEVRLTITGHVDAAHVAELQRLVDAESAGHRPIVLDLKDVKLVDREAVGFFVRCEASGIRLDNCPAYLREWIGHEVDETGR